MVAVVASSQVQVGTDVPACRPAGRLLLLVAFKTRKFYVVDCELSEHRCVFMHYFGAVGLRKVLIL